MKGTSPWELVYLLLVIVGIIVLAYVVSKFVGKGFVKQGHTTKYLTVVDKLPLGQDRILFVVKAGEKVMLLGVTQQHIEKLCDIDEESLPAPASGQNPPSFAEALKSTLKNNWGVNIPAKRSDKEEKQDIDNS